MLNVKEKEVLGSIKVNKTEIKQLLETAKRGRKSTDEMSEAELADYYYNQYVMKCERRKEPVMSRKMYDSLHEYYEFDELLSTEDYEENDLRLSKESISSVKGYSGECLDKDNVYYQTSELGRVDQGGGGTIAYIMGNKNMWVVDAGVAVLNMHAPMEVVSKVDVYEAYLGYTSFLTHLK